MTLTLRIGGIDRLDNGMPAEIVLDRRGATIGRAATCDWSLPDPRNFISSRHLEVAYDDGTYTATDISTNGTYLNGAAERMTEPRRVEPGDIFQVGMYAIAADLSGATADRGAAPAGSNEWDLPPGSPAAPVQQASAWSSPAGDARHAPKPDDIWGSIESSNVVDWARADFGGAPAKIDAAVSPEAPAATAPSASDAAGGSGAPSSPSIAPGTAAGDLDQALATLMKAAGLRPDQLKEPSLGTIERAGQALRHLVAGLVVMVEARARAKSQMGAEQTGLEFDGNNPIKFARSPDQALAQMLNPTERGFMPTGRAIEDAYFDLQSHQMATLKAMQGALQATLDRFSPEAIKQRAESGGLLSRLMPGGREAALWSTYEREFSGVAQGSAEAFMDVFAKEFRTAYDEQSRNRRRG